MKTLITLLLLYTCVSFTQQIGEQRHWSEVRAQTIVCDTLKANVIISTKTCESPLTQDWWKYALGFMVGAISVVIIAIISINQADKDCGLDKQ
jgi:hypothetical protein